MNLENVRRMSPTKNALSLPAPRLSVSLSLSLKLIKKLLGLQKYINTPNSTCIFDRKKLTPLYPRLLSAQNSIHALDLPMPNRGLLTISTSLLHCSFQGTIHRTHLDFLPKFNIYIYCQQLCIS